MSVFPEDPFQSVTTPTSHPSDLLNCLFCGFLIQITHLSLCLQFCLPPIHFALLGPCDPVETPPICHFYWLLLTFEEGP